MTALQNRRDTAAKKVRLRPVAREALRRKLVNVAIASALATAGTLVVAPAADARITKVVFDKALSQAPSIFPDQSPTFGRFSWGVLQYEKIVGIAHGEVNPAD